MTSSVGARALAGAVLMTLVWAEGARSGTCTLPAWAPASPIGNDVYGAAARSAGGLVYVAGGFSFSSGGVVDAFWSWNPATNTWTSLAPVPTPVAMGSLLHDTAGGRLYFFGGTDVVATVYNTSRVYDIGTNTWSPGPPMPGPRSHMGARVIGDKMYLVGGYSTPNIDPAHNQTWEFNPLTGIYTGKADFPITLGGPGSGVSGGRLYIMGGRTNLDVISPHNYEYDPGINAWTEKAQLMFPINVPGSTALSAMPPCNGDIILIGGGNPFLTQEASPRGPGAAETTGATQIYNVTTNTWSAGPTLPTGRSFIGAAQAADALIAVGGYNGSTTVTTVDRIQGPPLPIVLGGFTVE